MHGGDIYRNKVWLDYSVNVNLLGMPEGVRRALLDAVDQCHCYPDLEQEELREAISGMTGVPSEQLLCGNGASELFLAILRALQPKRILLPVPSFLGYEQAAAGTGARILPYEMKRDDGFCLTEDVLEALTGAVDLLILANPNNPVGNRIPSSLLERILCRCRELGIWVILDECFLEFTGREEACSYLRRTKEFPRLLVVRAFTKIFAIPGVRLGYLACGQEQMRAQIRAQLPEWNVSVFAQRAGVAATRETDYLSRSVACCQREREWLKLGLERLGFFVYPSEANYLLLHTELPLAGDLLGRGILIRDCGNYRGLPGGHFRIAVRGREDNERLLAEIGGLYADRIL